MYQQACKLGSSMASKLASSMRVQNYCNPAAKPFFPQSKNYNLNPCSLSSNTPPLPTPPPPPPPPMVNQPHIEYYKQPNFGEYTIPSNTFVHPTTLSQYQLPNFYYTPTPSSLPNVASDLRAKITHQIEYYFSDENLNKDPYLISLMDDKGWVPIATIANFNRVKAMCNYLPFIRDSLLSSSIIQVEGHNIRRLNQWSKWLLPPSPRINQQPKEISPGPKKIWTPVIREPVLKNSMEAKETTVVKSILKRPMMSQGTHVEAINLSTPLNSENDMVEEEKKKKTLALECSSPKPCQKTQSSSSSRSLLDVEFVRAYLAKGDEAFNDDTFSEYRPHTLKKKTKEPPVCGKGKSSKVGFSSLSPSRTRTLSHTLGLYLNYTCA